MFRKTFIFLSIMILLTSCSGALSDEQKYKNAIELYENADFENAKKTFLDITPYEDSADYINKCTIMSDLQGTWRSSTALRYIISDFIVTSPDEPTFSGLVTLNKNYVIFHSADEDFELGLKFKLTYKDGQMVLKTDRLGKEFYKMNN